MGKSRIDTPRQLRQRIRDLVEHQPITVNLERSLAKSYPPKREPWYRSQKEHWLGWLEDYEGPGYYGRQNWNRTAEFIYNHVVCPPMVLWLGEAAGIPESSVSRAASAAIRSAPTMASQSGAIRRIVSWAYIAPLLLIANARSSWDRSSLAVYK